MFSPINRAQCLKYFYFFFIKKILYPLFLTEFLRLAYQLLCINVKNSVIFIFSLLHLFPLLTSHLRLLVPLRLHTLFLIFPHLLYCSMNRSNVRAKISLIWMFSATFYILIDRLRVFPIFLITTDLCFRSWPLKLSLAMNHRFTLHYPWSTWRHSIDIRTLFCEGQVVKRDFLTYIEFL